MQLEDLLRAFDRVAANVAKLDAVWERAAPMIPDGPSRGSSREYDDLRRSWDSLKAGLRPIDGWTVTAELPDADATGQAFIDLLEDGEPPFALQNSLDEPIRQLDEYRFRLGQARRRAIRDRLTALTACINGALPKLLDGVPRDSPDVLTGAHVDEVEDAVREIERLLGDAIERRGRWSDLHRHLRFGQGQDWHDIVEFDWPSVRTDIEAAGLSESDPLPTPEIDLGHAATAHPAGSVTTGLDWHALDDDGFERLLFDILRGFPSYQNVEWLMKTRAPDRGRDLSAERVIRDDSGSVRTERIIVQAKHWTTKSVTPADITTTLSGLPLWEPPAIRVLIIATSGRFTADAVAIVDKHNDDGEMPFIEKWPDSQLESLLSRRPDIVETHHLRS